MPEEKFRLLCADDHEDTCLMLSTLFGQLGYEMETACDPEDALVLARERHFDLYILDARFHGSQRTDLCASILALDPRARVLFYSGATQDADRERALSAGAIAYVAKPDIKGLVAAVKKVLAGDDDSAAGNAT
ncbi:MAG: two-component system, response regulator RegA [Acidobacteriota bacterium]|nr:two-component system, response regulator RegA [Acidobacteriota bacterium]